MSEMSALLVNYRLQHDKTEFEQRYGWDNFLTHLGVKRQVNSDLDNRMYSSLVEQYGISDYIYVL